MNKTLLFAVVLAAPAIAHSACEEFFATWAKTLAPGRQLDGAHATCKPWPADPALTLAALPFPLDATAERTRMADLVVLVADSQSGAPLAHLSHPVQIQYHSIMLDRLTFDTARYQLTPTKRAFGVRVASAGDQGGSPYLQTTLTLYTVEGTAVRRVLDGLLVNQFTGTARACGDDFLRSARNIDMGEAGEDGYAALRVTTFNGCVDKPESTRKPDTRFTTTISYHAGQYDIKQALPDDG